MIILASQSPRRQELLKLTGLPFTVRAADIDETMDKSLPVQQEVTRVSRLKAQAIAAGASPDDTVLSVCRGTHIESEAVVTKVTFRPLCEEELRAYIKTGEPMDKAGSYGIQGYGAMFVSRIEGDYFSVMGLPLCPLCQMLRAFGVRILDVQEAQA